MSLPLPEDEPGRLAAVRRYDVLDTPPEQGLTQARAWRGEIDSKYAALYWPRIKVLDPAFSPQRLGELAKRWNSAAPAGLDVEILEGDMLAVADSTTRATMVD